MRSKSVCFGLGLEYISPAWCAWATALFQILVIWRAGLKRSATFLGSALTRSQLFRYCECSCGKVQLSCLLRPASDSEEFDPKQKSWRTHIWGYFSSGERKYFTQKPSLKRHNKTIFPDCLLNHLLWNSCCSILNSIRTAFIITNFYVWGVNLTLSALVCSAFWETICRRSVASKNVLANFAFLQFRVQPKFQKLLVWNQQWPISGGPPASELNLRHFDCL